MELTPEQAAAAVERRPCPKRQAPAGSPCRQAAAAKGNHGGRPKVIDDDMLIFARAPKDKGTPMPDIARKLVIKTGKNAGKHPSVASLYRALAETDAQHTADRH
jgi:hypothetical protein